MMVSKQKTIENLLESSNSVLVKKYIKKLINNQEKIYFHQGDIKYSGKIVLEEIYETCEFLKNNKQEFVLLKSYNSFEWAIAYISSKIMNKVILIITETADDKSLDSLFKNFKIPYVFEDNKFNYVDKNNLLNQKTDISILKENHCYDCIFTTGTTGNPKGIIISENAYMFTTEVLINKTKQKESDIELLSMPFSHSFGLARLRCSILNNQTMFITDGLKDFPKIYKKFINNQINALSLVPSAIEIIKSMLRRNSKKFGSNVKYFEIGSSSISLESRKWLKENFENTIIFHHYGMTEASRSFFVDRGSNDALVFDNCVGKVCSDKVQFKINKVDESSDTGEIFIKGPHLAEGYFVLNDYIKINTIDEWFATNDIGKIVNKNLILAGRMNSMINVGGQKVYPEEVEKFTEKLSSIHTCLCFGVPDKILGEVPKLLIQMNSSNGIDYDEVLKHIKIHFQSIPAYKRPRKIVFVDEIPLTQSGKKIRDKSLLLINH